MQGIELCSLSGELYKVADEFADDPATTIEGVAKKLTPWRRYISAHYGDRFCFAKDYHKLDLKVLRAFTFDEMCKLKYSSLVMMDESVDKLFQTDPQYEIIRKIQSSMWRWGYGKGTWNEIVDAYTCIRYFSFGNHPDFEVRFDHSTHYNECGYSKYSRTFLDGALAFLVYYKGNHVLTIGFSVLEGYRVLIQQVQLAKRTGNRWLYQIPTGRLEFVIRLFTAHFPQYALSIVSGECLVRKTLSDYTSALARRKEMIKRYTENLEQAGATTDVEWTTWALAESRAEHALLKNKITHLKSDAARLSSFYADLGSFSRGGAEVIKGLTYYEVHV